LAAKGGASVDKDREPFVYRAAVRRDSVLRARLRQFVDQVFDGEAQSLVLGLVEDESLSLDELRQIEQRIECAEGAPVPRGRRKDKP
jgi:predicted transcriptional regulator